MQPLNATILREPVNTPASVASATEPATPESLGWQLRAALPPLRLHSISLYDEQANIMWLSEGALGPDEHSVVLEGSEALRGDATLSYHEIGLEDGRVAILLPVRAPTGGVVGLAMILADLKSLGDGVVERLATPQIRTIMQKLAVLLRPAPRRSAAADAPVEVEVDESVEILELVPEEKAAQGAANGHIVAGSDGRPVSGVNGHIVAGSNGRPVSGSNGHALAAAPKATSGAVLAVVKAVPTISSAAPRAAEKSAPRTGKPASDDGIPVLSPEAIDDILEFELSPDVPAGTSAVHARAGETTGTHASASTSAPASATATNTTLPPPKASAAAPAPPVLSAASVQPVPVAASVSATTTSKVLAATGAAKALSHGATTTSRALALPEGMSLILELQPFSKLRSGGRTRRYEVLARTSHKDTSRVPPGFDKLVLQHLLTWLGSNRAAWSSEPTSFTLNLSISTLEDERFPQFVASNLKAHGIAPDNVGFEIAEALCLQRRAQVERFITLCDKLGCFVVIDDFSFESSVVSMLRSKALRLVKIDPKLTSVALKDKLAQAMVVAIAQAVKVLGIHCAAKRVESNAALQWLGAIGCDFAQGPALSLPQPLESLATRPAGSSSDGAPH